MPPLPTTPNELSDIIVDFLHDDKLALQNAGLVCKSWLPASRFHLFSNVNLTPYNVHTTLEVLCAQGSTIPPYVLHLTIEEDRSEFANEAFFKLPLLINLKSLSLGHIQWENLTFDSQKRVSTMSQNLATLHLYYFTFETSDQAIDLIASAPSMKNLSLYIVNCDDSCDFSSQATAPPLERININMDSVADSFIDWFCRCNPTPSVHTLVIGGITMSDVPTVCNFIYHLGPALENLAIACVDFDRVGSTQVALSKQLDLSQNRYLRNISFEGIVLYKDTPGPRSSGWIIHMLSQMAHRSLESVTLVIFLGSPEEVNVLDLSALDVLFLGQSLSENSTQLCFKIRGIVDKGAVRDMVKAGLRRLDAEGRLEFDVVRFDTIS